MPSTDRLLKMGTSVSGSAFEKWLTQPLFDAFSHVPPITRERALNLKSPSNLALARLNRLCHRLHIRSRNAIPPACDLAAIVGVGERTLLAACIVMEAYDAEAEEIFAWIETLKNTPHRTRAAAAKTAVRKGAKRKHTV